MCVDRRPRRRRGQLIPMIGVVLIVFGFMAVSYMFHSQTVTSVTGIATYGHKARFLATSVAEEVGLVVHQGFDELRGDAPWKQELLSLLEGQEDGTDVELDKGDVSGQLLDSVALIDATANAELLEATVKLHGFHRIAYSSTDAYDNPEAMYHSEAFGDLEDAEDPGKLAGAEDWIGFATIKVRVAVRGIERQVQVTHDLKVVDTTPMAREFVFMNYKPLDPAQEELSLISLNQGGFMTLWPNEVGRIMMRGPYQMVTEGEPDGSGGRKRSGKMRQNKSYPINSSRWYRWASIPGLRALRWNVLAWPWGTNLRPKKDGLIPIVWLRIPTVEGITVVTSDRACDANSQKYFCASVDVGKQKFSVWGEPGNPDVPMPPDADGNPPNNGFSMFRGHRVNFSEGGEPTIAGTFEDGGNGIGGGSNGQSIQPEGNGLLGLVNHATFRNVADLGICVGYIPPFEFCVGPFTHLPCFIPSPGCPGVALTTLKTPDEIDPESPQIQSDQMLVPYGLHYMEEESIPWWQSLLEAAITYVFSVIASGGNLWGGTLTSAAGGTAAGAGAGSFAGTAWGVTKNVAGMLSSSLSASMTLNTATAIVGGGTSLTAGDIAGALPDGYFPPRFRLFMRGATRIHPTLTEALSPDGSTMNLDGVVMVERMPQAGEEQANFTYRGRGLLFTGSTGEDGNKNPFLGDIVPENPEEDWMSFVHLVPRPDIPVDGGDCQVHLNSNELELSIFADEGVTTETESSIYGNLVTGYVNKHRLPEEAKLNVFYNYSRLAKSQFDGPPDAEWSDGTWTRVTVSPKVSGYYDRYR